MDPQPDAGVGVYSDSGTCQPWRAWLVHVFTTLGIVAGLLSLVSVFNGDPRGAIIWMLIAAGVDGIDGPVARAWGVAEALPKIDGGVLDVVADFVGCVVVPLAFVWQFDMLPPGSDFAVVSVVFVTSALWFSRNDMMTPDHWFNGFPAGWNLMVPTLFLLHANPYVNAGVLAFLAFLQLTSVKFVHPVRVLWLRSVTLPLTLAWVAAIAILTALSPDLPAWGPPLLLAGPLYQAAITVRRTFASPAKATTT